MCTVTFLPTGPNEFIFTSNRDESPKRSAVEIIAVDKPDKKLLYPRDPKANGTWIAVSNTNQLVCILNGAFQKHKHRPPYRLSRGIMALDFFSFSSASDFIGKYDFNGIEPFTMAIYDDGDLYELRWDENKAHAKKLDITQQHLWSSCTLYPKEWQIKRQEWLSEWNKNNQSFDQEAVLDFHKNAGENNIGFDIVMNRAGIVRTTSITSIVKAEQQFNIRFEDVLSGAVKHHEVDVLNDVVGF